MPETTQAPEELIAISDPGDRNRDEHKWGDRLVVGVANVSAWLFPLLIIAIVAQVVIRKSGHNQAWLDDAQWWIYGFAMMAGFAYAITTGSHVRVDVFHHNFSDSKKARVELFALGWLLLPFLAIMSDIMTHYAYSSWVAGEGSDSPNGLHRLYLLKISLPILFLLAVIATWSALTRNMEKLTQPALWKMSIAALPALWFIFERLSYYALWWFVRFTNPDLKPRRISKEPLLEHSTWAGLGIVVLIILFGYMLNRKRQSRV